MKRIHRKTLSMMLVFAMLLSFFTPLTAANEDPFVTSVVEPTITLENYMETASFWTITFDSDGGSAVDSQRVPKGGSLVVRPADPTRDGYIFLGWYYISPDYTTLFNFDEMRANWDLTLTAKWEVDPSWIDKEAPVFVRAITRPTAFIGEAGYVGAPGAWPAAAASDATIAPFQRTFISNRGGETVEVEIRGLHLEKETYKFYLDVNDGGALPEIDANSVPVTTYTAADDQTAVFVVPINIPANTTDSRIEYALRITMTEKYKANFEVRNDPVLRIIVRADDEHEGFYRAGAFSQANTALYMEHMKASGQLGGRTFDFGPEVYVENPSTAFAYPSLGAVTTYATREGKNLTLRRITPAGTAPAGGWPTILFVPGSAWGPNNIQSNLTNLNRFAMKGYSVITVEYVPARGADITAPFPEQILNLKLAIDWAKRQTNINSDKIIVMGTSSGGHTVNVAGVTGNYDLLGDLDADRDYSVAAIVNLYGPNHVAEMNYYPSTLDHNTPVSPEGALLGGVVVTDPANAEAAEKASPMYYLNDTNPTPPTLIIHGDVDALVNFNQSVRLYAKYRELGKDVEFYKIPGGGHGGGHFWADETIDVICDFMASALEGDRVAPPADANIEIASRVFDAPHIWDAATDGFFPTNTEAPAGMKVLNVDPVITHTFIPSFVYAEAWQRPRATGAAAQRDLTMFIHAANPGANVPVIVYAQGAGFGDSYINETNKFGIWAEFVRKGYAVAGYDLMGSTGTGNAWPDQDTQGKLVIQHLKANAERYGINPDQIITWGDSSGGHAAAMLGVVGEDVYVDSHINPGRLNPNIDTKVMAVVNQNGPPDLEFMNYYPSGLGHTGLSDPEGAKIGADVLNNPDLAWDASPGKYITPERKDLIPAFFIIHGDNDSLIHIAGNVRQYNQLLANGNFAWFFREINGAHSSANQYNPARMQSVHEFMNIVRPDVKVTGFTVSGTAVESAGGSVIVTFEGYGFEAARANLRVLINGVNPVNATVVSDTTATATVAIPANKTFEDALYKLTAQLNTLPTGHSAVVLSKSASFWTITFDSDGGSAVASQRVPTGGSLVVRPTDPTRDGYIFLGWYYISPGYTTLFNFDEMRANWDLTLTAKWEVDPSWINKEAPVFTRSIIRPTAFVSPIDSYVGATAAWPAAGANQSPANSFNRAYVSNRGGETVEVQILGMHLEKETYKFYLDVNSGVLPEIDANSVPVTTYTAADDQATGFVIPINVPANGTDARVEYVLRVTMTKNGKENYIVRNENLLRIIVRPDDVHEGYYNSGTFAQFGMVKAQEYMEYLKTAKNLGNRTFYFGPEVYVERSVSSTSYASLSADIVYATRDGVDLKLRRITPAGAAPAGGWPTIVYVPGSAWSPNNIYTALTDLYLFAKRGYSVITVEYLPAYGGAVNADFPEQVLDAKLAVDWAKRQANINGDKIILMGTSSGGHTANLAGVTGNYDVLGDLDTTKDYSVAAIVNLYGPNQFAEMNYYPSTLGHNASNSPEGAVLGGVIVTDPASAEAVAKASPMYYLNGDNPTPPTLILHGDVDALVPFNQSVRLYAKYRELGKDVEFYKLLGAGHGGGHFWAKETIDVICDFMASALAGDRVAPPADANIEIVNRVYNEPYIWNTAADGIFPASTEAPAGMKVLAVDPVITHSFVPNFDYWFDYQPQNPSITGPTNLQMFVHGASPGANLPCIISTAGGGFRSNAGNDTGSFGVFSELAHRGFVVVDHQYIGSSGIADVKWDDMVIQTKSVIRYMKENASRYGINPDQIVTWGHSAGGYISVMTGVTGDDYAVLPEWANDAVSSSVMAVVNNAGVTDLDYMNWFPSGDHANASGAEGSLIKMDVLDNPDVAWEASAGKYITPERKDKVPAVFIIHGDNDSAIHIAGSVNQYNQLLANGNYAEFHREIGGAHSLHSSPDRLDAIRDFIYKLVTPVGVTGFAVSGTAVESAGGSVIVTFEGYGFEAARANLRVLINGVNPINATVVSDTTATATVAIPANKTLEDVLYKLTAQLNTLPTGHSAVVLSKAESFWTITFDSDGGSAVASQRVPTGGSLVVRPTDPTRDGYIFLGWYYISPGYTTLFNFNEMRANWDLTLTAKWEIVESSGQAAA